MSIGINAAQLERMRNQVEQLLPGTAIIQAPTYAPDEMGSVGNPTYAAVTGGTVACRLDPISTSASENAVMAGRETLVKTYRLTLPHDAPLAADCRVVIGANTYGVMQIYEAHSWNVSVRGIVEEVE